VRYRVILTDEVKAKLRDLSGDVKKLKGSRSEYRLRVGDYRVLFELEGRNVTVYAVGARKDIYR
jgi:mRNA-degrading endonuclease RelE of RelBE toxin-antitoxin system